jgi:hypothetical protein
LCFFHSNNAVQEPLLHYCCKCTETYVEEEELKVHFRELHSQFSIQLRVAEKPRRGLVQCSLCGSNVTSMKLHRTTQHRMGPAAFQCMVSGKKKPDYELLT